MLLLFHLFCCVVNKEFLIPDSRKRRAFHNFGKKFANSVNAKKCKTIETEGRMYALANYHWFR